MNQLEKVEGVNKGRIVLYALSTCVWCQKTKKLLTELGVEYEYIFFDQLDNEVEEKFNKELELWNPKCSFPTLVINDNECIVGYEEAEIRRILA